MCSVGMPFQASFKLGNMVACIPQTVMIHVDRSTVAVSMPLLYIVSGNQLMCFPHGGPLFSCCFFFEFTWFVLTPQRPNAHRLDSDEPLWRQVLRDLVKDSNPEVAQQAAAALAE